jgi:hypothetical protein
MSWRQPKTLSDLALLLELLSRAFGATRRKVGRIVVHAALTLTNLYNLSATGEKGVKV